MRVEEVRDKGRVPGLETAGCGGWSCHTSGRCQGGLCTRVARAPAQLSRLDSLYLVKCHMFSMNGGFIVKEIATYAITISRSTKLPVSFSGEKKSRFLLRSNREGVQCGRFSYS